MPTIGPKHPPSVLLRPVFVLYQASYYVLLRPIASYCVLYLIRLVLRRMAWMADARWGSYWAW